MLARYKDAALARLDRVVYSSRAASVTEVVAFGPEEIPLDAASVAFISGGYFKQKGSATTIVDANYAVLGGEGMGLLAGACKDVCACTIIRFGGLNAPIERPDCALISSPAFLTHARLLGDARGRRGDIEAAVYELVRRMRCERNGPSACTHSRFVTEIRRLINEQPAQRISLASIARELYVSPFTASRLFHRETGIRLRDYALRLRLRKAVNLLTSTSKSLTTLAIDLGFYDEPHFSNAFRSEFGEPPQSVRKYCTRSDFC
jgi:AraC-like DNA-binding protein